MTTDPKAGADAVRTLLYSLNDRIESATEFLEERYGNSDGLDWADGDAGATGDMLDECRRDIAAALASTAQPEPVRLCCGLACALLAEGASPPCRDCPATAQPSAKPTEAMVDAAENAYEKATFNTDALSRRAYHRIGLRAVLKLAAQPSAAPQANRKLPEPDTHCFDEDTGKDVWSYSAGLVQAIIFGEKKK